MHCYLWQSPISALVRSMGLTIVYQKGLGSQPNQVVQMFIGIFLMLLIFSPAVVISILFSIFILPKSLLFYHHCHFNSSNISIYNISICGNLLDNTEISNLRGK